jgi:hypothetical protein
MDIRDAYVAQMAKDFEESGHNYSHYIIQIAADAAVKVTMAWTANEPKPKRNAKKPSA